MTPMTTTRRGSRNPRAEIPAESFDDEGVRRAILAALEAVYECFPHITLPQYLITLEVRKAERDGNPHRLASIVKKLNAVLDGFESRLVVDSGRRRYRDHQVSETPDRSAQEAARHRRAQRAVRSDARNHARDARLLRGHC